MTTPRDGKEGVDGSSPSEGFQLLPAQGQLLLSGRTRCGPFNVHRTSTDVHRLRFEGVEYEDRALAAVAGEVRVVAIDHVNSLASLNS